MPSVAVAVVAAPWGPVHVAATERGVAGLEVLADRGGFELRVGARLGRPVVAPDEAGREVRAVLDQAVAAVERYLAGEADPLALPLDLEGLSAWDRAVLGGVRAVPFGRTTSYGRLAGRIGRRGAARAVGGAVGRNPIGLLVPCHRVIAGDGTLGGYGGDWFGSRETLLAIKRALLELEGVELPVPVARLLD